LAFVKDLGFITNVEVIDHFVKLDGRFVIDVGCGSMTWTRHLSDLGARVLAIDPDPVQADLNRAADTIPNVEFAETGADKIPLDRNSVDGVFFSYSLHHIPAELYPDVFDEVLRVLKPDGFLYVIEPIDCPINEVIKLFHNEDQERAAAWSALEQVAMSCFQSAQIVKYHSHSQYDSFDDFAKQFASRSFNSNYAEADIRSRKVQETFQQLGHPNYRFTSSKQVMFLQR